MEPTITGAISPCQPRMPLVISTNVSRILVHAKLGKICELRQDDLLEDGRVNNDILQTRNEKDV